MLGSEPGRRSTYRRRSAVLTWLGAITVAATGWIAAETVIRVEREKSQESAAVLVRNVSGLFSEHIGRVTSVVDRALISLRDRFEASASNGAGLDPRTPLGVPEIDPVVDMVLHVAATDRSGRIITSTHARAVGIDVSDREYFIASRDDEADSMLVSEPVLSRATGELSVAFVRRIRGQDGVFAGMAQVVVGSDALSRFYRSIDLGPAASVALLRSDGTQIAVAPAPVTNAALVRKPRAAQAVRGITLGEAAVLRDTDADGRPRTTAYRAVPGKPLIVRVSIIDPEFVTQISPGLQGPRVAAAVVTVLSLLGLILVLAYQRRLNAADAAEALRLAELAQRQNRLDGALANMNQGLLMVDAAGDVVLINGKLIELLGLPEALWTPPYAFADLLRWQRGSGEFEVGSIALAPDLYSFIQSGGIASDSRDPFLCYERVRPNGQALEVRSTPLAGGGFVRTFTDITERHRFERELAAREQTARELAKIAETTPNQVVVTDTARGITWVNEPARRFIGRPIEEIVGRTVPELLFGPESVALEVAEAAIDRVRHGESIVLDHARYGAGGAMIWITETLSPITNADGVVTAIFSVATDITERRKTEDALRDMRNLLEDMSTISDVGGWDLDLTTQTLRWTEHTKAIHGVSPAYIPDLATAIEFYAPEARDHVQAAVAHTIATGEPFAFEQPIVTATGERRWVCATGRLSDAGGQRRLVGAIQDITERHALENELVENQRLLTDIAEIAGVGGWEYDIPSQTLIWLDGTRRMFELDADFVVTPQSVDAFCTPEAREAVIAARRAAIKDSIPFDIEVALITARGRPVWMRFRGRRERDATRDRLIGTFQDVTSRKSREQTIERYAEDLERFAHVASHDLQEPLRKIATHTRLLGEALAEGDGPEVERCRAVLEESAGRGRTIVADLLRYAKLKDKPLDRADVPLAALIDPVVTRARDGAPDADVEVVLAPVALRCDAGLVTQIVENLIGNALKYRKPGTPAQVRITAAPDIVRGGLKLAIRDCGIGFDMAHAETIFKPFKRLVRRDEYQGTGIGLSLVRSIAEKHGWTVSAESMPGEGSTFTVAIPASDVVALEAARAA